MTSQQQMTTDKVSLDTTYDHGMDVQPNANWSTIKPSATTTTTTTSTSQKSSSSSTTQQLEQNLNPTDKQDPTRQTKALPFAASSTTELQQTIQSRDTEQPEPYNSPIDDHIEIEHNGNILDRTMDQVRSWIQSLNLGNTSTSSSDEDHEVGRLDSARAQLYGMKDQVASRVSDVSASVRGGVQQLSSNMTGAMGQMQQQASGALQSVSERATAAVDTVKHQLNDYVVAHQSQPGEPLSSTITSNLASSLPSQSTIKNTADQLLPPLAQKGAASVEFVQSFGRRYLSTYRDFLYQIQRQSYPIQLLTGLLFVTHLLLPIFFFDKETARSVMYYYVMSSVLSHLTFFLSGNLRYMFLAHLVFLPLLLSLVFSAGFSEAGDVSDVIAAVRDDRPYHAAFVAPLSVRSYFFIVWLRIILLLQSAMITMDAINVMDLLGFSLETRKGQEMNILRRRMKELRKQAAKTLAPPPSSLPVNASSSSSVNNSSDGTAAAPVPHQKWVKKAENVDNTNEAEQQHVVVQSYEKNDQTGLRHREPIINAQETY